MHAYMHVCVRVHARAHGHAHACVQTCAWTCVYAKKCLHICMSIHGEACASTYDYTCARQAARRRGTRQWRMGLTLTQSAVKTKVYGRSRDMCMYMCRDMCRDMWIDVLIVVTRLQRGDKGWYDRGRLHRWAVRPADEFLFTCMCTYL